MFTKVAGSALVVALLGWLVFDAVTTRHRLAQADTELAELRQNVVSLSGDARTIREATAANGFAVRSLAQTAALSPMGTVAAAATVPAPRAAPRRVQTHEQRRDEVQRNFESDVSDPQWNRRETTQKLTAALPEGVTLGAVECRASICEVETTALDPRRFNEFVFTAFSDPERAAILGSTVNAALGSPTDRPRAMVSYVTREAALSPTP